MKRFVLGLTALSFVLVLGCTTKKEGTAVGPMAGAVVVVDVTVRYVPATGGATAEFTIVGSNMDDSYVSINAGQKIRWHLVNATTVPVSMTVDNFINNENNSIKDPFGAGTLSVFQVGPVGGGENRDSRESNVPLAEKKGPYKYKVSVTLVGVAKIVIDPRVVVRD